MREARILNRRAADGEALDFECWLSNAARHALTVLAAGSHAGIERQVVADHGHLGQDVGAVADERRTLYRTAEFAILDHVGFRGREHELARGDVNLAAAEIDGVEALLHRTDNLLAALVAAEHERVGHARHGMVA